MLAYIRDRNIDRADPTYPQGKLLKSTVSVKCGMLYRRAGVTIDREQTARLMHLAGVCGKSKGKTPITTRKGTQADTRPDVVNRDFTASCPNRLWVADITYVRTRKGFVYAAFSPMYSPAQLSAGLYQIHCVRDTLPLQACNQAITAVRETTGLIHHTGHGPQYVSVVYNQRLKESGITASTGTVLRFL